MPYYKAVRLNHTSHYDQKTRWHEGAIVTPSNGRPSPVEAGPCAVGIHCSPTLLHAVSHQSGPSDYCEVQPLGIIAEDTTKARCSAVQVLRWLLAKEQDALAEFKLYEANHSVNPLLLQCDVTLPLDDLLHQWASVGASVGASVWDSVGASVWASVWDSVGASVLASVWDSVGDSVWASVRASVRAYIGGLFPSIPSWKYAESLGLDPWRPLLRLWYGGYVPSYDGKVWRLHAGPKAEVVYELKG